MVGCCGHGSKPLSFVEGLEYHGASAPFSRLLPEWFPPVVPFACLCLYSPHFANGTCNQSQCLVLYIIFALIR